MDTGFIPLLLLPISIFLFFHRIFFSLMFICLFAASRSHFICQMRLDEWNVYTFVEICGAAAIISLNALLLISLQQINNATVFFFVFFQTKFYSLLRCMAWHGMLCVLSVDIKYPMQGKLAIFFFSRFSMSKINTERNASLQYY